MSSTGILGQDMQAVQEQAVATVAALTASATVGLIPLAIPVGFGPCRLVKVSWVANAVLAGGGAITVTVTRRDSVAGANRVIVNAGSIAGGTANAMADFTLAAETALKEQTLNDGDHVRVDFIAASTVTTNGVVAVVLHFHPVPNDNVGNDVKHQSNYR